MGEFVGLEFSYLDRNILAYGFEQDIVRENTLLNFSSYQKQQTTVLG